MNEQSLLARSIKNILMAGVGSAFLAAPTMAQQTDVNSGSEEEVVNSASEQRQAENQDVEKIQITGSRIARIGASAPSPVTVISGDDLVETGAMNIGEVLSRLPALATTFTLANSGRFIGTAGISTLNLRNMGTDRTLVLVDGKRHVASAPGSSAVDTNTIPSSWIERVEIITGGASAVYGADAVTGVVNFILKKNIEGLDVTATRGYAENSDYSNEKYTFSYGTNFAGGRGNIAFSAEYNAQESLNALDNPWTATSYGSFGWESLYGPRTDEQLDDPAYPDVLTLPNAGYYAISTAGTTWNPFTGGVLGTFNPDGSYRDVYTGDVVDPARLYCQDCDYINLRQFSEVQPEFSRVNYNLKGNYEINNDMNFYYDAKYVKSEGQNIGQPFFRFFSLGSAANNYPYAVKRDNAFMPEGMANQMDELGVPFLGLSRMYNDAGRRIEENTRETTRAVAGLEGMLNQDWSYDVSLVWGKSDIERVNGANVILQNMEWALDAVDDGNGNIVCRSEEAQADGCVPYNPFGQGMASDAAQDYVTTTSIGTSEIEQVVFNATFSNSFLYELPAGFIGFAGGVEYRDESSVTVEDDFAKTGATFFNALGETDGSYDVSEVFGEVTVPLLANAPLVQQLNLDAAVRYADYSTIGGATAWKLGLDWTINDELRSRFTYSEAIRAPNIDELFSGQSQSFANVDDPCKVSNLANQTAESRAQREANCAALGVPAGFDSSYDSATLETLVGGNPDLMEETSESITAGIVYSPSWFEGFSATVDYWEIDIDDTISGIGFQTVLNRCVDAESVNNQFCDLVTRDPATGEITLIRGFALNIARSLNSGVDFEMSYDFAALGGQFNTNLIGTKLIEAKDFPFADEPDNFTDYAGVLGDQELQLQFNINYSIDNWAFGTRTRFLDGVDLYTPTALENNPNPSNYMEYGSYAVTDVTAGYTFDNGLGLTLGVDNFFNRGLPGTTTGTGAGSAIYDNIGRFAYLRASFNF
ncbi:TonB-dependent receptor plug domain-containing protein [Idiomarina abyssalis]|jgi:outer membrane receptor protein involved in Fe transport|uniref:TonB-dependent receptor plug domain-containing protein n=2 Tax=Idiomarina TaxID=135575 RepID=UPI0006C8A00F|nr:TonB-dependent receptor [Idiomarina abyssalis]SFT88366.1 TonB-dependent Receptor Plug Domain [Idiomarina abyssalis]